MNDHMHTGISEATRLTQQGRLDEATAAIQRALGGTSAPAAQEDPGDAEQDQRRTNHPEDKNVGRRCIETAERHM